VTGLEAVALQHGGPLLAKLAVPAAQKLGRNATFRRRVAKRVRKRVEFSCPWRAYRRWLKSLSETELATPVEDIHAVLAQRLDQQLRAASQDWAESRGHLSRALTLVELTYPAVAGELGDADRAVLCESWAQQRNVTVRELLFGLAGPTGALTAADLSAVLLARSVSRREVRLQAFVITESQLSVYFEAIEVPLVPSGGVLVLLGDFGSGKSEIAEAWHRAAIADLMDREDAPQPAWLSARDVGQGLQDALTQQVGTGWSQGRGAYVVVDGLDETDPAKAQALLDAARVLARAHRNVQVLLTARPGSLEPRDPERLEAPLLSEQEAIALVELAGGERHSTWRWTSDMRATVRRPFFALAAGGMLARDLAPQGEADLIRGLVEDALRSGRERAAVTTTQTQNVLTSLAVNLTTSGADGLSFAERQVARSSRLTADGLDGAVRFALPIFQHWFAAQAILSGIVPAAAALADRRSFSRWRWAAAVAALGAADVAALDELVATWVSQNPGAAAWILQEAFGGHRAWRASDDEPLDPVSSGPRLLAALRCWTDALGPVSERLLPAAFARGPVGLGVRVSGPRIDIALSRDPVESDLVLDVPFEVHPLNPTDVPEWRAWFSGAVAPGDAWPWTLVRGWVADQTLALLSRDADLGPPDGVWVQELRYDLARLLLGRGSLFHGDLPANDVRARAEELFEAIGGRNPRAGFQLGGARVMSGAEIENLLDWLDASGAEVITSSLPERDLPSPSSGWIWGFYSREQLMRFEAETYGRACDAYDETLSHSLARLGWSLPSSALAPFGVILFLDHGDTTGLGRPPVLSLVRVPMPLMKQLAPRGVDVIWARNGRAVIAPAGDPSVANDEQLRPILDATATWLTQQGIEVLGDLGWSSTGADDMAQKRPASSAAAQWLFGDLKALGLGSGTFPQLG